MLAPAGVTLKILLTGAGGFVGGHLWRKLRDRHQVTTVGRRPLPGSSRHVQGDLEEDRVLDLLSRTVPDVVVHLTALTDADRCEEQPERARAVNAEIPARLASVVPKSCRRFVQVSTDLVFDGERAPYGEADAALPISVYGRTKLEGEREVVSVLGERACIARLALTYGPRPRAVSRPSFIERMVASASRGEVVSLFEDEFRTPIYVEDAAHALAFLVEGPTPPPVVHLGGPDRCSRLEMGAMALTSFGLSCDRARACSRSEIRSRAPRPRDVSLVSSVAVALGLSSRSLLAGLSSMKRDMERLGFMVGSEIAVPEDEATPL
jgi:dTDP-4-dehydrorhamnose reductase